MIHRDARRSTVWFFLVPALAFYLAFVVLPIAQSFVISFFEWNTSAGAPTRFVGLRNYADLLHDAVFWRALAHNAVLLVLSLAVQLPLALFMATLLSGRVALRGLFRTAFFAPMVLSTVVISLVWEQLLLPSGDAQGLVAGLVERLGFHAPDAGYLGDPHWALLGVIAAISWRYVGFHMVLYMAGIEQIPEELFEAARIDGANAWQTFRYITLPSLGPVIRISAVLSIVGSLKYFDLVYVMTRGGPNHATELVATWMYDVGITQQDSGYGSAIAVGGFLISMAVVLALMTVRRRGAAGEAAS